MLLSKGRMQMRETPFPRSVHIQLVTHGQSMQMCQGEIANPFFNHFVSANEHGQRAGCHSITSTSSQARTAAAAGRRWRRRSL